MTKKLITIFCATMFCLNGYSQNLPVVISSKTLDCQESYGPKKGNFTAAVTLGYNSFVTGAAPTVPAGDYSIAALPSAIFTAPLMVGVDGSWFFNDDWALRFGGGLGFTHNPGYSRVDGTFDSDDDEIGDGSVPTYGAVGNAQSLQYNAFVGANRYFQIPGVKNLYAHAGFHAGVAYANNEIRFDDENYMGNSVAEAFNIRASLNAGVEYYFLPAMFVGIEVNALQYTYNVNTMRPQEGLQSYSADSHNFSFLAAPTLKIGFKF